MRIHWKLLIAVVSIVALTSISCSGSAPATPPATTPTVPSATPTQPTQPTQPTATMPPSPEPSLGPGDVQWSADGVATPGEYANELSLGKYRLFWSSTDETIRIAMQADAQGWVAIGFQPSTRMKNADMVFGMMADGEAVVLDQYSTGDFGPHSADVQQGGTDDLLSFAGVRTSSMTTFEFERRLDTGDSRDVSLQRGLPIQVIWAYGSSDSERVQHSARGYAEMVP